MSIDCITAGLGAAGEAAFPPGNVADPGGSAPGAATLFDALLAGLTAEAEDEGDGSWSLPLGSEASSETADEALAEEHSGSADIGFVLPIVIAPTQSETSASSADASPENDGELPLADGASAATSTPAVGKLVTAVALPESGEALTGEVSTPGDAASAEADSVTDDGARIANAAAAHVARESSKAPEAAPHTDADTGSSSQPALSQAGRALVKALTALHGEQSGVDQATRASEAVPQTPAQNADSAAAANRTPARVPVSVGVDGRPASDVSQTPQSRAEAATYQFAAAPRGPIEEAAVVGAPEHLPVAPAEDKGRTGASKAIDVELSMRSGAGATIRADHPQIRAADSAHRLSTEMGSVAPDSGAPEGAAVVDQLVKAIRLQVKDGIGEARIRLRPEHLGEVQIELKIDRDRVSAILQVERSDVRAQIEAQTQALRAGLESQGLHLEELKVREDEAGRDDSRRGARQPGQRRARKDPQGQRFVVDEGSTGF